MQLQAAVLENLFDLYFLSIVVEKEVYVEKLYKTKKATMIHHAQIPPLLSLKSGPSK